MKQVFTTLLRIILLLVLFCLSVMISELFKQKDCIIAFINIAFFCCGFFLLYTNKLEKLIIIGFSASVLEFFSIKYWKDIIIAFSKSNFPMIETRMLVDNALCSFLVQLASFLFVAICIFLEIRKGKQI